MLYNLGHQYFSSFSWHYSEHLYQILGLLFDPVTWYWSKIILALFSSEAYSESFQTYKVKLFAKIDSSFHLKQFLQNAPS